jgi:predicted enzyme related to lactoylglutathione lyase
MDTVAVTGLRWDAVTVDCRDAVSRAAFWAALLGVDLHVPAVAELPGAVERAVGLGARLVDTVEEAGMSWRVMADPEGNLFCLVAEPAPAE